MRLAAAAAVPQFFCHGKRVVDHTCATSTRRSVTSRRHGAERLHGAPKSPFTAVLLPLPRWIRTQLSTFAQRLSLPTAAASPRVQSGEQCSAVQRRFAPPSPSATATSAYRAPPRCRRGGGGAPSARRRTSESAPPVMHAADKSP